MKYEQLNFLSLVADIIASIMANSLESFGDVRRDVKNLAKTTDGLGYRVSREKILHNYLDSPD